MNLFLKTFLIVSGVGLTLVADICLKKSGGQDWRWIAAGVVIYGVIALPVAVAFKYTEFGKLFLIWEAVAVILGLAVATWHYHEPFTSHRVIALVLAIAALYFAET